MPAVEERVDRLEQALENFITNVGIEFNKLYNSQMRTEAELRDFKEEMRQQNREMNIKWGELANKMGTLAEDLVAPSLPRIVKEEFGLEVTDLTIRRKRKLKDGSSREYDALTIANGYVFLNSTKSTLRPSDVERLIEEIKEFRDVFPEYKKHKIIGILASLYVDESIIKRAEKVGFLALAVGDQLMEVRNTKGFKPKEW
jgi:hypothetical protein